MTTRREIEEAVRKLSPEDLDSFRTWFADFDAESWDRKFETDAKNGRLDALASEALKDFQQGRANPCDPPHYAAILDVLQQPAACHSATCGPGPAAGRRA
jgi:hypothetical protein